MKKPLIGIVGNLLFDEGGMFPGYDRAYVNNDYVQTTVIAGGAPFILPLIPDYEAVKRQVEAVDGIIISGGYDVDPLVYGEEPSQKTGWVMSRKRSV